MMLKEQLSKFLVRAKKKTYASNNSLERILEDGARELLYEEEIEEGAKCTYRDRYFGLNPFIGEEIVSVNGKPIWGMNYYGSCINFDSKRAYGFLKRMLRRVGKNKPFRGPEWVKNGNYEYFNSVTGSLGKFKGEEKILFKGQLVYLAYYHGGFIE